MDPSSDGDSTQIRSPFDPAFEGRPSAARDLELSLGEMLGRYIVVEVIGTGGMGRVYRAYDPKLRREIALKLLRASVGEPGVARLLREAQAMAQLAHPNVVPVYDVEPFGDAVFITMEYVAGTTLHGWMRNPRSWREIVAVFREAGRGLAAAHTAGIVHRDFKPHNVLVGDDGRVRVTDFGLARGEEHASVDDIVATGTRDDNRTSSSSLSEPLTEAGVVMGTPPYMPPESQLEQPFDARGDQYSFCVTLFEALYGKRPFEATDMRGLLQAKTAGRIEIPSGRDVPAWLTRIVVRGLAVRPQDRFPSMDALLLALGRDPPQRRRALAIGGIAGALALASVAMWRSSDAAVEPCSGGGDELATAWGAPQRAAIGDAFTAVDKPYAALALDDALARLDGYGAQWIRSHREACLATAVRGEQSQALLDSRMRCLDGRLEQLSALTETLASADAAMIEHAATAIAKLPDVSRCDDPQYVSAQRPPPDDPVLAAAVDEQRQQLARAKALEDAGRFQGAFALATEVAGTVRELDDPTLQIATELRLGQLQRDLGGYEQSAAHLRNAFFAARRAGVDEAAIEAATALVFVVGSRLERHEEALSWTDHARAEIDRAGGDGERAELEAAIGALQLHRGEVEAAEQAFVRSLELHERVYGEDSVQLATALENLGAFYGSAGRWEQAEAALTRAVAIAEAVYGPDHPANVDAIENLGNVYNNRGRREDATRLHLRSLAIQERASGPDTPGVGETCINLAYDYMAAHDYERARAYFERALDIFERRLGPTHPHTGHAHSTLALALRHSGDLEGALRHAERGVSVIEAAYGREHPSYAAATGRLAEAQNAAGRFDAAEGTARRSIEVWASKHGEDSSELCYIYNRLGQALIGQARYREATEALERALRLHAGDDPNFVADVRFQLARALHEGDIDRERALEQARLARDRYAALGPAAEQAVAHVEAWIAARSDGAIHAAVRAGE